MWALVLSGVIGRIGQCMYDFGGSGRVTPPLTSLFLFACRFVFVFLCFCIFVFFPLVGARVFLVCPGGYTTDRCDGGWHVAH